uniref:Uncharacterized protein n=1 Tax=Arundo donax TaxID=35708 RepID=A0A0A9HGD4_ARUDO
MQSQSTVQSFRLAMCQCPFYWWHPTQTVFVVISTNSVIHSNCSTNITSPN